MAQRMRNIIDLQRMNAVSENAQSVALIRKGSALRISIRNCLKNDTLVDHERWIHPKTLLKEDKF